MVYVCVYVCVVHLVSCMRCLFMSDCLGVLLWVFDTLHGGLNCAIYWWCVLTFCLASLVVQISTVCEEQQRQVVVPICHVPAYQRHHSGVPM